MPCGRPARELGRCYAGESTQRGEEDAFDAHVVLLGVISLLCEQCRVKRKLEVVMFGLWRRRGNEEAL
jgi:hypothetical protein